MIPLKKNGAASLYLNIATEPSQVEAAASEYVKMNYVFDIVTIVYSWYIENRTYVIITCLL